MKTVIKFALIGAALAGGAAQAATITNLPSKAGGSDLILAVTDTTTNHFFVQDLGNQLDTIYSKSQVQADGVLATPGSFTTPTSISGNDALLASFLSSQTAGDTIQWTILAADSTGSTSTASGANRALLTSVNPLTDPNNTFSNVNVATFSSNLQKFAAFINSSTSGYAGGNTSSKYGWGDGQVASDGKNAPVSWIAPTLGNGAAIGTAQTMYLFGTNGNGSSSQSNIYVGGTVSIDSLGNITVANASATPIPAAVWLLGSGLLGLMGVGRRRLGEDAVAAV
jgi:hypothetical protein